MKEKRRPRRKVDENKEDEKPQGTLTPKVSCRSPLMALSLGKIKLTTNKKRCVNFGNTLGNDKLPADPELV